MSRSQQDGARSYCVLYSVVYITWWIRRYTSTRGKLRPAWERVTAVGLTNRIGDGRTLCGSRQEVFQEHAESRRVCSARGTSARDTLGKRPSPFARHCGTKDWSRIQSIETNGSASIVNTCTFRYYLAPHRSWQFSLTHD
jgi:hypothetical protein